jgi:ribosomal protein S24E
VFSFYFEKDNIVVKRKRQHYGQKKKTTLWSKEKDNTMVKRKRQHYGQKKKTTLRSTENFDHSVVFSF